MKLERLFDLPPKEGNPRNSEGAFLPIENERVLFVYSHFTQGMRDDAAAALWVLTLKDGKIDEKPRELLPSGEAGADNLMSVSLLRMGNGDVGLFYLRRKGNTLLEMVLRRSADEGRTWSEPVPVTTRQGFFVVNNDRVIRLQNGNILVPAAEHKKMMSNDRNVFFDARSEAVFFLSEDDGCTFRELYGKGVMPYASICKSGLQEPGVLEMKNGCIWAWARTDLGAQWEMYSFTGGETWTPAAPSCFTGPQSPLCVKRLSDGRMLALYNPVPLYNGKSATVNGIWTGGRTPLSVRVSCDDGAHWDDPVNIETDEGSGYCYTAIMEEKPGSVLLSYCAGGQGDGSCLTRLRVARLTMDD